MNNLIDIGKELIKVREKNPLVHHLTNYVTVNDCANITLAIGASPVMADDINEVEDMISIASALVINIGTLNSRTVESMILAGKRANELNIPIVLDPVGVGATKYRTEVTKRIIEEVRITVVRGNLSEIKTLYGVNSKTKGVDSLDEINDYGDEFEKIKLMARNFSKESNMIIAITGAVDIITDGNKLFVIKNGNKIMSKITGTGCMCTSLIGSFLGATENYFLGTVGAVLSMGIAGEIAKERLGEEMGTGSLKVNIIDSIYNISNKDIEMRGKISEE